MPIDNSTSAEKTKPVISSSAGLGLFCGVHGLALSLVSCDFVECGLATSLLFIYDRS